MSNRREYNRKICSFVLFRTLTKQCKASTSKAYEAAEHSAGGAQKADATSAIAVAAAAAAAATAAANCGTLGTTATTHASTATTTSSSVASSVIAVAVRSLPAAIDKHRADSQQLASADFVVAPKNGRPSDSDRSQSAAAPCGALQPSCSIDDKQRADDATKAKQSPSNAQPTATASGSSHTNNNSANANQRASHTAFAAIVSAAPDSKPTEPKAASDSAVLEFAGDASSIRYGESNKTATRNRGSLADFRLIGRRMRPNEETLN